MFFINEPRTKTKIAPDNPIALVCVLPFVPSLNLISFFPIANEPIKIATNNGISSNYEILVIMEVKKYKILLLFPVFE